MNQNSMTLQDRLVSEAREKYTNPDDGLLNIGKYDHDVLDQIIRHTIEETIKEGCKITENTSDGYHTFKELYDFRLLYNAHLFNEWSKQGKYDVHKSQRHNDGELCFGRVDYFIVVATLPTGQISNHYPMSDWDLFKCEVVEKAKAAWDGHTSQDVAKRLRETLTDTQHALRGIITNPHESK
jgi:hypothetical protein